MPWAIATLAFFHFLRGWLQLRVNPLNRNNTHLEVVTSSISEEEGGGPRGLSPLSGGPIPCLVPRRRNVRLGCRTIVLGDDAVDVFPP